MTLILRLARMDACGKDNPKISIRNPVTRYRLDPIILTDFALYSRPGQDEHLLGRGYDRTSTVPGLK